MGSNITTEMNFLEQLLDKGITSIADDFENEIGKKVILAAKYGEVFCYIKNTSGEKFQKLIHQIPVMTETEYYFQKTQEILFYQLSEKERRLIIGMENVKQEEIIALIEKVRLRSLALKTYLDLQEKIQGDSEIYEKKLAETFIKSNANIYDIIGFHNIDLKTDQYYGVLLLGSDKFVKIIGDFCAQIEVRKTFSPILWNNVIVVIIAAASSTDRKAATDIEIMASLWQRRIAEQFGVQLGCGIGRFYTVNNLHKSYIEAQIALNFPSVMGKESIIQSFDNLGVFSMIFSQDISSLKEYISKTLGPILSYDREFNIQLVDTLRILLNNDLNWAKTAKDMYAHVNTIYYRYDKIEKLLNLDLSKGKDRSEAFAVLKVWDVLRKSGFIEDDFSWNI